MHISNTNTEQYHTIKEKNNSLFINLMSLFDEYPLNRPGNLHFLGDKF